MPGPGGVVSNITPPDVILFTKPALFSAHILIIFGFPIKKKVQVNNLTINNIG